MRLPRLNSLCVVRWHDITCWINEPMRKAKPQPCKTVGWLVRVEKNYIVVATSVYEGEGDEVCGYDLELIGLNGLTFSAFNADPGANLLVNLGASSLRINGLDTVAPTPGPQRIGELQVNPTTGGEIELTGGEAIGADLESETLASTVVVAVPEPALLLLLGSGIGLLVVLARRRRGA